MENYNYELSTKKHKTLWKSVNNQLFPVFSFFLSMCVCVWGGGKCVCVCACFMGLGGGGGGAGGVHWSVCACMQLQASVDAFKQTYDVCVCVLHCTDLF